MGTVAFHSVDSWRVRPRSNPDDGEPVGRRKLTPREHTATHSHLGDDGRVVYGEELPIGVYASEVRELPAAVIAHLGIPRMHAWLFTMTRPRQADPVGRTTSTVCFSALPYSQNRYFSAAMRPTRHRHADVINRALVKAIAESEPGDPERRLQRSLDELSFVPFQHQNDIDAAWMVAPSQHELLGVGRFERERDYTIGLCHEWELCVAQLRDDPLVTRLLDRTREGTLFQTLPDYTQQKKGPVARAVSSDAKASCEVAMGLAIELALAGLVEPERLYGANGGRPRHVALQVEPIYRDIIYRWSKRTALEPPPPSTPEASPPPTMLREQLESLRETLRATGESAVMQRFCEQVRNWDPSEDTAVRLVLACPVEWPLPPELVRFLRLALGKLDPESLEHALVRQRLRG